MVFLFLTDNPLCLSSKDYLVSTAKEGEWEFLASGMTDTPPLTQVEGIVREKLFLHLKKEIPYVIDQVRLGDPACSITSNAHSWYTGNMLCSVMCYRGFQLICS